MDKNGVMGEISLAWPDRFSLWWGKKGLGTGLTIEFACDKIPRFFGALIVGNELKRGANDSRGQQRSKIAYEITQDYTGITPSLHRDYT